MRNVAVRGFTLIELMIVVSIIATLAAIAVPNMLRSRMAANETAAIASLKALAQAEHVYRRADYDGDGILEFGDYDELSVTWKNLGGGNWVRQELDLVDRGVANAHRWTSPFLAPGTSTTPRNGYYFHQAYGYIDYNYQWQNTAYSTNGTWVVSRYGFTATPASYDGTGVNMYAIDDHGHLWMKDAWLDEPYRTEDHLWFLSSARNMRDNQWMTVE